MMCQNVRESSPASSSCSNNKIKIAKRIASPPQNEVSPEFRGFCATTMMNGGNGGNSMMTNFSRWQQDLHRNLLEVPDSQPPYNSKEEFHRLISQSPSGGRLFHGESFGNSSDGFSMPSQGRNLMESGPPLSDVAAITRGKRRSEKQMGNKTKKAKQSLELSDSDGDGEDEYRKCIWTDAEVNQLIAFRQELDDKFKRDAKKQGVNVWDKVHRQMLVICPGFNKSTEACKKKWKTIYRQYNNDKRLLQVSGEGKKVTCKYFDEIDVGFHNQANVKKFCHEDARDSPNPCPIDLNDVVQGESTGDGENPSDITPQSKPLPRKSNGEVYSSYMGDLVSNSTRIVVSIEKIEGYIHSLTLQLERLIDKL